MKANGPNYKKIYTDIIDLKFPEKKKRCERLINKKALSYLDILALNKIIFDDIENHEDLNTRQVFHSYDESSILHILDYQKKHKLNNSQVAKYFKLSRNSVAKWKRIFLK